MLKRTLLVALATLLGAMPAGARQAAPVPAALKKLRSYQVVEQVVARREVLNLSEPQVEALSELADAIRTEKHQYSHRGGKPHETRHVPMVSQQHAFDEAMALLTAEQQASFTALYPAPAMPRRTRHRAPGKP